MRTSEYINMCKEAPELNNFWNPRVGDEYIFMKELRIITDHDVKRVIDSSNKMKNGCYSWIPNLSQLYDIVAEICKVDWNGAIGVIDLSSDLFKNYYIDRYVYTKRFGCHESMVLSAIMDMNYGKSWNGKTWIDESWHDKLKCKGNIRNFSSKFNNKF